MKSRKEELTRLGFAGLVPLVAGAVLVWLLPAITPQWVAMAVNKIVLAYAGVIAAYMAGAGAGAILASPNQTREPLLPGMIAALIAWIAILPDGFFFLYLPFFWRYALLILVFAYLLLRDLRAVETGQLPSWYGNLRVRLTLWACLSMALIATRMAFWGHA